MMSCVLFLCLTISAAPAPDGVLPLFAEEAWYKEAKSAEMIFEGVIERNPDGGGVGRPGRFNVYRLVLKNSKPPARELYLPGKAHLLATHVGQSVRVIGKAVDTEADGKTYHEIWPARIELPGAVPAFPAARDGVYARGYWRPADGSGFGTRHHVIRTGEELEGHMRLTGAGASGEAGKQMAQLLNVPAIDWKKHMLVSISAGIKGQDVERLSITRAVVADGVLTVSYHLIPPAGGAAGFGIPAEIALVDRFDGEVRIQKEIEPPKTNGPARP